MHAPIPGSVAAACLPSQVEDLFVSSTPSSKTTTREAEIMLEVLSFFPNLPPHPEGDE